VEEQVAALGAVHQGMGERPLQEPEVSVEMAEIRQAEAALAPRSQEQAEQILGLLQRVAQGMTEAGDQAQLVGHRIGSCSSPHSPELSSTPWGESTRRISPRGRSRVTASAFRRLVGQAR